MYSLGYASEPLLASGRSKTSDIAINVVAYLFKQAIDLLNVAFENPRSLANRSKQSNETGGTYETPDRLTGRASYQELSRLCPSRHWNFVEVDVTFARFQEQKQHIIDLMRPSNTAMDLVRDGAYLKTDADSGE